MIIRKAHSSEAVKLTQIAHEAKKHWGYPEHWIKHWEKDLTISPEVIEHSDVFVAETDGELVGFYALVPKGNKAELDHMWVLPAQIGGGVGKQLFLHAMERAAAKQLESVEICADPNARGFYEKMGAYHIGDQLSEIEGQERTLPRLEIDPRLK
jgi:N-acetylglutamate synthase-like GNAT family acetyltransferase